MPHYSNERKQSVISKMNGPDRIPIPQLAKQEGISTPTLYNWRNEARAAGQIMPDSDQAPDGWDSAAKFRAVLQAATLTEQERAAFCREQAILPEQLKRWTTACEQANDWDRSRNDSLEKALRNERQNSKDLQKEIARKEKALAETAAILVLRKKLNAILGDTEA